MARSLRERDLTHGPLGRQILLFSLPLVMSNMLQILFHLADIAVVGRFAGTLALGAVGSSALLASMFVGFFLGLGGGINVQTARAYGSGDRHALQSGVHTSFLVSLLLGIAIMVLGLGFSRPVLMLLNTKPELLEGAVLYIHICLMGVPAMAIFNHGNAVFSAVGDTKTPLRILIASGILNVVLNLVFVLVLHMDVAGVALATILSQYLSAVLVTTALFRTDSDFGLRRNHLRLSKEPAMELLRLGIPGGLQNCIFAVANLFMQAGLNTFDAVTVAGSTAAANADTIVYDVMAAFYTACASFMGQNYGAGKKERILKSYFISMLYAFIAGAGLGVLLIFFGRYFLLLFTADPAVIETGMQRLVIMGASYGLSVFMDNSIFACRALGKAVVPSIIVLLGSCVFRIIWVETVFAYFGTIASLYLLYCFSWTITGIAEVLYFVKVYRQAARKLT